MRRTFLLNLLFITVITYLAVNFNQIWRAPPQITPQVNALTKSKQGKAKKSGAKTGGTTVAALSSYKIIGQRNLFRPDRKEWTPPPKPKPKPKPPKKKAPPPPPPPPPPEPLPEPEVVGIIIDIDKDTKVALMKGHKREEISAPARRSRRGRNRNRPARKRYRVTQEPMGRYHEGDIISEATIIKIEKDRVKLERDGSVFQVLLRDPKKRKKRSGSSRKRSSRSRRRPSKSR